MEPLVSIITPAYKAEKYIESCIDSVVAQSYRNWELIIVDDCSPDNTAEVVKQRSDEDTRIKLISLEKNQGVVNARNTALDYASGQFIAFLDSDDLWLPEKLSVQINAMLENGWAMTYSSYSIIDEEGKDLAKTIEAPVSTTYRNLFRGSNIGCLTVVINREITGDFKMPHIHHEDYATWLDILKRGYVAYGIQESLAKYRKATGSLSGNKLKAASWQWNILREYLKFGVFKSTYYFVHYALNGIKKSL
jgi:glycosyltransferase involved in cell wall biosynthesis